MREILFRGKSVDGNWHYGDLLQIGGGCLIYHGSKTETEELKPHGDVAVELLLDEIAVVYPGSVGVFTGLIDSNNKKIFEGDILKVGDNRIYKVEHKDNDAMFVLRDEDAYSWHFHIAIAEDEKSEVIGNIHDNPELLKGGNNENKI